MCVDFCVRNRRQRGQCVAGSTHAVSIHARLRGAGRPIPREETGSHKTGFNPRPAPRSRATRHGSPRATLSPVSIHARLRGAGRPRTGLRRDRETSFQSTPGSEEPGDGDFVPVVFRKPGFNPRPAPRSRATICPPTGASGCGVSIHARLRGAGRHAIGDSLDSAENLFQSTPGSEEPGDIWPAQVSHSGVVSIHARLRGAGRRGRIALRPNGCRFQSTPGSEEPGDSNGLGHVGLIDVSIHARLRGAGRQDRAGAACARDPVSIHARLRGAGRPLPTSMLPPRRCFNPRPAPRSRATCHSHQPCWRLCVSIHARLRGAGRQASRARRQRRRRVSIHARLRGAGRPLDYHFTVTVDEFQSTPGSEEPGDTNTTTVSGVTTGFNPRPAPRSRATVNVTCCDLRHRFQSTPGSEEPGDTILPSKSIVQASFNPRPAPRSRATGRGSASGVLDAVSIHARLRGAGRPAALSSAFICSTVSIHARLRGAGRPLLG